MAVVNWLGIFCVYFISIMSPGDGRQIKILGLHTVEHRHRFGLSIKVLVEPFSNLGGPIREIHTPSLLCLNIVVPWPRNVRNFHTWEYSLALCQRSEILVQAMYDCFHHRIYMTVKMKTTFSELLEKNKGLIQPPPTHKHPDILQ